MSQVGQATGGGKGREDCGRERREAEGEGYRRRETGEEDTLRGMEASFSGIEKTVSSRN